jgi:hypothetical protein
MSRGHGEVQRFVLDHLQHADSDVSGRTMSDIASSWVHHWLITHNGHNCEDYDPEGLSEAQAAELYQWRTGNDVYMSWLNCRMGIELRRADVETVRRAVKSLAREGLVRLDYYIPEVNIGSTHLLAYIAESNVI